MTDVKAEVGEEGVAPRSLPHIGGSRLRRGHFEGDVQGRSFSPFPTSLRRERRVFARAVVSKRQRILIGAVSMAAAIGIWQLVSDTGIVDPIVASSPSNVVRAAIDLSRTGILGPAVAESAKLFGMGFAVSLISGLAMGLLLGWYPRLDAAFDPFVSILYAVPRISLVPLIMVWVGIGFRSQVVIVWVTAVFPIVINTAVSVSNVDRHLLMVARSLRATSLDVLRTIALPGAIPGIVAGVRQSVALALIGVVVAEYFVGNNGIGGLIVNAGETVNTAEAYVGVLVFAIAAIAMNAVLRALERRLSAWRQ